MTENAVSETERMVITRVFDAPRELVLEGKNRPEVHHAVVGTEGLYFACLQDGFSRGGKLLCCMRSPDGQEGWNAVEYHPRLFRTRRLFR